MMEITADEVNHVRTHYTLAQRQKFRRIIDTIDHVSWIDEHVTAITYGTAIFFRVYLRALCVYLIILMGLLSFVAISMVVVYLFSWLSQFI